VLKVVRDSRWSGSQGGQGVKVVRESRWSVNQGGQGPKIVRRFKVLNRGQRGRGGQNGSS
jgi:hypothetical protein